METAGDPPTPHDLDRPASAVTTMTTEGLSPMTETPDAMTDCSIRVPLPALRQALKDRSATRNQPRWATG